MSGRGGPPSAVLSDALKDLLSGRRVTAGVFLTYTLEPDFFEKEVLTLLSPSEKSQVPALRLLQLEQELLGEIGPLTVVYDRGGLRPVESSHLNVRYAPVSVPQGCFHPKVIALLTEPTDPDGPLGEAVVLGVLSANLTRSGWWQSLEAAHFEVIEAGSASSLRDDLRALLKEVAGMVALEAARAPFELLRGWLRREVSQAADPANRQHFRAQMLWGRRGLDAFLGNLHSGLLEGLSLEVISPFFDHKDAGPLRDLVNRLAPPEVRVFLPTDREGRALCTDEYYRAVERLPHTVWAPLDDRLLNLGKDAKANRRSVHAKLYRFTGVDPGTDLVMVGSHNLTTPALGGGRNFEVSVLVSLGGESAEQWWLGRKVNRPRGFVSQVDPEADPAPTETILPVQLVYDWATHHGQYRWDGGVSPSPPLRVSQAGPHLFDLAPIPSDQWMDLNSAQDVRLAEALKRSALVTVEDPERGQTVILVQEVGMSRKPSMLVTFNVTEILECWSRLTPEQQADFLEARLDTIQMEDDGAQLRYHPLPSNKGFFATYAGIFHGFEMLRQRVADALDVGEDAKADYLLFGDHHDSLPRMLTKIDAAEDDVTPVERYLILLSAQQLLQEYRGTRGVPFFEDRRSDLQGLLRRCTDRAAIVAELELGDDQQDFLEWFERHFLRRLQAQEASQDA